MFEEEENGFDTIFVPNTDMKYYDFPGICRYNLNISCTEKQSCYHCGWNPVISAKRVQKIREAMRRE